MVTLEPIDEDNLTAVFALDVAPSQRGFVARNPWSLAQALVDKDVAWPRAIVADGEVVGFLMLEIDPDDEDGRCFYLWRLMVGAEQQGRGYGYGAVIAACDEVRARGGVELYTSWVEGEGGPGPFYEKLGFVPTGEIDDGETVGRLVL
ncbi:MAG: GNAT family N-acetyltransferase [Actinomycetota bacterium]|nr:GNAT family N-acetyltransferase [Actinomycetota bacterium]